MPGAILYRYYSVAVRLEIGVQPRSALQSNRGTVRRPYTAPAGSGERAPRSAEASAPEDATLVLACTRIDV